MGRTYTTCRDDESRTNISDSNVHALSSPSVTTRHRSKQQCFGPRRLLRQRCGFNHREGGHAGQHQSRPRRQHHRPWSPIHVGPAPSAPVTSRCPPANSQCQHEQGRSQAARQRIPSLATAFPSSRRRKPDRPSPPRRTSAQACVVILVLTSFSRDTASHSMRTRAASGCPRADLAHQDGIGKRRSGDFLF